MMLAASYPSDHDLRANVPQRWGQDADAARAAPKPTINVPLSPREETILSREMGRTVNDFVNNIAPPAHVNRTGATNASQPVSRTTHTAIDRVEIVSDQRRHRAAVTSSPTNTSIRSRHAVTNPYRKPGK